MKHRCRQCDCDCETEHWHGHDTAHGIPGTHMAGSERYVCQICGVMTWAGQPFDFEFIFDKPTLMELKSEPPLIDAAKGGA